MILSVLLPFKESESYFQDCLDSLTNQTFQDFEVIAVNDGSKDQSSNILKKWAKSRLHVVREIAGPCQGIGMALKTGAQFCRGDFIARMDSDDTCDPCRFELQIEALHKESSLKLLGCNSWIIDKRNCRVGELSLFSSHDVIRRSILFKNPFVHGSVCFERKAFEEIGGYSGNEAYVEDYELWFRMTSRFPAKNNQRKHSKTKKIFVISLLGNQQNKERVKVALEVISKIKSQNIKILLNIYGHLNWTENYEQNICDLKKEIYKLKLNKCISYKVHYSQKKLNKILKKTSVLLHTQSIDAAPTTVSEAIAAMIPVVYINNGGTPEIVGKAGIGVNYRFSAYKKINHLPEKLAHALIKIKNNYKRYQKLAENQRAKLSVTKWQQKHITIFKKLNDT